MGGTSLLPSGLIRAELPQTKSAKTHAGSRLSRVSFNRGVSRDGQMECGDA